MCFSGRIGYGSLSQPVTLADGKMTLDLSTVALTLAAQQLNDDQKAGDGGNGQGGNYRGFGGRARQG
ncbi:hypothetical protein GCM10027511_16630 [Hymenobacter humi]